MALIPLTEPERLPPFNLARGAATDTAPPPFDFQGVTMRVFPLKADFLTLAKFCDNYLNLAPEFACFRPSMSFVLLCIVNYGKMSLDAGNLGWTSQNELLFSVPLEWYEPKNGSNAYKGLAQVAPFIFVDNEASQVVGREVYGWPKVQGWFTGGVDAWARHPRARRHLLGLTTNVFERLYLGERPEPRELLLVEQEPTPSFTMMPPELDGPLNPLVSAQQALVSWSSLMMRAWDMVSAMSIRGYAPIDRQTLPNLLSSAADSLNVFTSNLQANTINLKQFRDAVVPDEVCYQALTNARMDITQFRRGGMLGDLALLGGDLSGGFRIGLTRFESQPIIETLGLEVEGELADGETKVALLKPVLPFWQEMDLRYLKGEVICWRTKEQGWRSEAQELVPASHVPVEPSDHLYNTTGSAGFQVVGGPYRCAGATIRVLPLPADPACLQTICDGYLNGDRQPHRPNDVVRFEPYGRYVYLVISSFDSMRSESNDVGCWGDRQVQFAVPVRWYQAAGKGAERTENLASIGFFSPFMYAHSAIGLVTGREVNGWPTCEAEIASPPTAWLNETGPFAEACSLLQLSTAVFPALGMGRKSEWRQLIEVLDGNVIGAGEGADWDHVADTWGRDVKADLESQARRADASPIAFANMRALAIEVLCNGAPFNQLSLKQFRDTAEPTRACYQSLVRSRTVIERLHDLREIERPLHVKIHRYPTQPIVAMLGLTVQSRETTPEGTVDCLQPLRPFYMRADIKTDIPENISVRAGSDRWYAPGVRAVEPPYFLRQEPTAVGRELVDRVDERHQRLRDTCLQWADATDPARRLGRVEAAESAQSDIEPQMIVQATLSREWENHGDPRWLQQQIRERERASGAGVGVMIGRRASDRAPDRIDELPVFVVRRDSVGTAADELFSDRVPNVGAEADYWTPGPGDKKP